MGRRKGGGPRSTPTTAAPRDQSNSHRIDIERQHVEETTPLAPRDAADADADADAATTTTTRPSGGDTPDDTPMLPRTSPSASAATNGGGALHQLLATLPTAAPECAGVYFYRSNPTQTALFWLASAATLGVLPVICLWYPQLHTRLTKQQIASIDDAEWVLAKREDEHHRVTWEVCPLHRCGELWWFLFRKSRHFYDPKKQEFVRLRSELQEKYGEVERRARSGYTQLRAEELLSMYGPNSIDLAPMPWQSVLLRKILHPFYLFQVASALIWFSERYTTYALIILVMSAISITWEVYSQVSNDKKLHELVHVDASVKVVRDQHVQSISVAKLVVGDIVVIEEGLVPADMVVIAGECTADESTLTGEAIPITKQQLHVASGEARVDPSLKTKSKECVLHAGSTILATKGDQSSRGIVLATGFSTSKGELFRSIIYPRPINFRIEQDSYRFLGALSIVAILAFIKRMIQASKSEFVSTGDALVSSLDLVTIAVPPALPLVLTIGVGFALTRLEAAKIFCINSQRINLSGHVDCFCFDKTGTLSSDHLDFQGVDECSTTTTTFVGLQSEVDVLSINAIVGLATCHGLNERSGHITGYALELDMFRATGYSIETNIHKRNTPNAPFSVLISSPIGKTFGIVKRYLFDASLQRSSVLIEDFESGQRVVYTKGSPEAMQAICNPASIPANYFEKVRAYSYQGYYVVALASKTYPVTADVPQREAMECRLNFMGFILFLNKIKTESPYVISTLEEANVDVRIITGDNAFTAIHVARKINMELQSTVLLVDADEDNKLVFADVDDLATQPTPSWTHLDNKTFLGLADNNEFALTGAALEQMRETQASLFVEQVILKTKIFSRIRPQQKTWIVETLIQRGKCVGMVGDGTNDCGALKAAHVGIALSDADASIVAPFTSRQKQISDVVDLLREGRCALSTSFVAFKFMVLYSIIQVTMSSLMNDNSSQFSNNQFLFDDLVIVFMLSILMVRTAAAERLTKEIPAKSLFAPTIVFSLAGQIMLLFICLGIALSAAKANDWFCSASHAYELTKLNPNNASAIVPPCYVFVPGEPADLTQHSYENSVIWLFGHLQYWVVVIAFNVRDGFRKPFYTNKSFTLYAIVLLIILMVQLFSYKSEQTIEKVGVDTTLGVLKLPAGFTTSLFFLFLFDLGLGLVWELLVVGVIVHRIEQRRQTGQWFNGTRYKASAYVADRDSLLGEYDNDGKGKGGSSRSMLGTSQPPKKAPKNERVGPVVSTGAGDDDDDEEEDVLNKEHEIVYVAYDSS